MSESKKQKRAEKRKARREQRAKNTDAMKSEIASFCGIGGNYSALELLICAASKLSLTVRGDIHPNKQLAWICRKIDDSKLDKERVFRCKTKKDFYSSRAWKILRYQAFEKHGNRCQCCGSKQSDGAVLHVDHIKPKSKSPELALDLDNLQILCEACNTGKINQWETDWR